MYFLSWNYSLCLAFEVFLKVKHITNTSYSLRVKAYHIFSLFFAVLFTLLILGIGSFGKSLYGTCFVKKDSSGHYVELVPLLFNFPLILIFGIISIKIATRDYEPILISLGFSNFLLAITLTLSNILAFIEEFRGKAITPIELDIAASIGSCSGLVLSGSRLFSRSLFMILKNKIVKKSVKIQMLDAYDIKDEESKTNYLNSTMWNLGGFFEIITKKTVAEILITLHIWYCSSSVSFPPKIIIRYTKEKYEELGNAFPYVDECNAYLVYNESCTIIEYNSAVFAELRKRIKVSNRILSDSLINSENFYNIKADATNSGGKSTSFFFLTADEKFILKTIKSRDRKIFLKKMLNKYILRINQNESRIVRILGVYKVFPSKLDFVIMENIIPNKGNAIIYDIKGYANTNRKGINEVHKDMDFVENFKKLEPNLKKDAMRVLELDLKLLREIGIIDYSILIGVYSKNAEIENRYLIKKTPVPLVLGIIDIFQDYNYKKKLENKLLKIFSKTEFSCVEPSTYYNRIIDFLIKYL